MTDTLVSLGNLQRYAGRVKTEVDKAKQVTHFVGEIFGIIGCASTYVPTGCLPCDGTEYSKSQFNDLYTNYLTATTPLLETCSYADYATAISTYGQCAKWAVDTVNLKFKVPTVKDGSYLTQALSDGELGKSYNESLPNIVGAFNTGDRRTHIEGTSGAIFKTTISGNTWGEISQYQNNTNGVGFDASRSSPVYQNNAKVQGDNVRVRYFVCVAGGSINQSMMDWSAWESGLASKLSLSGGTMTGILNDRQGYAVFGIPNTPEAHNCFYRGKEHTVEGLSAKVLAEDWSDIFIGDYFKVSFTTAYGTVTNEKVLVAGINYFKNCGDTTTPTPHLVMIPENGFGSAQMNSSNSTSGGYKGSAMHSTVLPTIASALKNAIGSSHVVSRRNLLSNTMNSSTASMAGAGFTGASTGWGWESCDLCLMSEPMVYGTKVFSSSFFDVGDSKQQLPIFALNPQIANTRSNWWLSAVNNSTGFAQVNDGGNSDRDEAFNSHVVRPLLVFR